MSEALRVALVAEGPTDRIVIEAALKAILGQRHFVLAQLQPEGSTAFGQRGTGWGGVYRWCKQAVQRGAGRLSSDSLLFSNYDLLILHLDAEVAGSGYDNGNINPQAGDGLLPCAQGCPPAEATTNALRQVLLSWCGETAEPAQVVICMPSKSTEAWVVASLFPNDQAMSTGIECYPDPETRLGVQPKPRRISKTQRDYRGRASDIEREWPRIACQNVCGEALRFQVEMCAKLTPS